MKCPIYTINIKTAVNIKRKRFFFEIEEEEGLEDNPGMSQKLTNCCMRACMDKIKSQRMQWNLLYKYINTKVVSC